jgi:hypothetical protein
VAAPIMSLAVHNQDPAHHATAASSSFSAVRAPALRLHSCAASPDALPSRTPSRSFSKQQRQQQQQLAALPGSLLVGAGGSGVAHHDEAASIAGPAAPAASGASVWCHMLLQVGSVGYWPVGWLIDSLACFDSLA